MVDYKAGLLNTLPNVAGMREHSTTERILIQATRECLLQLIRSILDIFSIHPYNLLIEICSTDAINSGWIFATFCSISSENWTQEGKYVERTGDGYKRQQNMRVVCEHVAAQSPLLIRTLCSSKFTWQHPKTIRKCQEA